jgi:hypothetical protein
MLERVEMRDGCMKSKNGNLLENTKDNLAFRQSRVMHSRSRNDLYPIKLATIP